jgi:bacterioferritin-associated ferredoxin
LRDTLVCRCEEVSQAEIEAAIKEGALSLDAIKKATHAGMGLCQGRTCSRLVRQIVAREAQIPPGDVRPMRVRPPVRAIALGSLEAGSEEHG